MVDLKTRTKAFALRIIRLYGGLPTTTVAQVIGKQLLRSGTAVGANYREASRGRSTPEFVSKLQISLQELEETHYWLELLVEAGAVPAQQLAVLQEEANQLTAILVTCINNARKHDS
jgi:four helix bundle protein